MTAFNVLLGIDHAARDSGRRLNMRVLDEDPLSAAIQAEGIADQALLDPVEYTHAIRVTPISVPAASLAMAA